MKTSVLWSLRLGFSSAQSEKIETMGLEAFLNKSFNVEKDNALPKCLEDSPKSINEYKELLKKAQDISIERRKEIRKEQTQIAIQLQAWWLEKMMTAEYPLLENMICFWHNHFVSTIQKVKVSYWIYQHHMILRNHAFGNFKTLTKLIVKSNAMISYLDNAKNRNSNFNENLSRELLELFTLGIGNYTESDIKNGSKALAGMTHGDDHGVYRRAIENNDTITYLGKTGTFKADDLIDIIFEQPEIPYLVTKKLLRWFVEDEPSNEKVKVLGDYFREVNFEIKPLLTKMFTEEYNSSPSGTKIKDPLRYIIQLTHELNLPIRKPEQILFFLKQQGMELFNQPNVKGWVGGNSWLSSQTFSQREDVADLLCTGRLIRGNKMNANRAIPKLPQITPEMKSKEIIATLSNHLVFQVSPEMQSDMETLLKYDFDPSSPNANLAILRVFNYLIKTPEFQII